MMILGIRKQWFGVVFTFLFLAAGAGVAKAQVSAVTATITDSDGQTWNNGKWSATLYNPFPANLPSIGGVPLTNAQLNLSGVMSNSGVLTGNFSDNSFIAPSGTQWQITICPNASVQCSTGLTPITGAAPNLSSYLSSITTKIRFPASPTSYGYLDAEVSPIPNSGGQYFNVTSQMTRQWTGTAWQNGGGGGGGLSGQTVACAPKAATATTSTGSLPVCDDGTTTTLTHPTVIPSATFSGPNPMAGTAGAIGYGQGTFGASALPANVVMEIGPTSVPTPYAEVLPSAVPSVGQVRTVTALNAVTGGGQAVVESWTTIPSQAQTNALLTSPGPIGSVIPGPIAAQATNYTSQARYGGNQLFAGAPLDCSETFLPGDNGGLGSSTCLTIAQDNDWSVGWDYGSPGQGSDNSWFGHGEFAIGGASYPHNGFSSYSAGIHQGIFLNGTWAGPGDKIAENFSVLFKPAMIAGSDEGINIVRTAVGELPEYLGTVAVGGGGAGATTITLNCTANCPGIGLNSPLIDLASVQAGTVTSVGLVGGLETLTTSLTVTSSFTGTLAAAVDVPRTIANNTGQLSKASVTVNFNTATALTTSSICDVLGAGFAEIIQPTAVGSLSGGVQSITAIFRYSHAAGEQINCGGAVGSYIEVVAASVGSNRYLEQVYASTAPHTITAGHKAVNNFDNNLSGLTAEPIKMYQGAEVVGVINPGTGAPDGGYLAVMPNAAAWTNGDNVEDTNNISSSWNLNFITNQFPINNPYALRIQENDAWPGLGGALQSSGFSGWKQFDNSGNTVGSYAGAGGIFKAPFLFNVIGPVSNGLKLQYAPLLASVPSLGNCSGYIICANALAPGATTTQIKVLGAQVGTRADSSLFFDAGTWSLGGNLIVAVNTTTLGTLSGRVGLISDQIGSGAGPQGVQSIVRSSSSTPNLLSIGGQATGGAGAFSGVMMGVPNYQSTQVDSPVGGVWLYNAAGGAIPGPLTVGLSLDIVSTGTHVPGVYLASQANGYGVSIADGNTLPPAGGVSLGPAATVTAAGVINGTGVTIGGVNVCQSNGTNCPVVLQLNNSAWNIAPSLFSTVTMLGAVNYAPYTDSAGPRITVRQSGTISCTVAPTINFMDLGVTASTAYGSATSIASVTTATTDGVFTGSGIIPLTSTHYYGIAFSAGTCVTPPTFDISVQAAW